ncbi:MAG: hypothetical protein WBP13_06820 [Methylophilaceae bacterium]
MSQLREKQAIDAYLKLLKSKGVSNATLDKRGAFLQQLSVHLLNKLVNGVDYRLAVETTMDKVLADDWHETLQTAREYFAFWAQDIKSIAAYSSAKKYDLTEENWKPAVATLKALTDGLATEKFETSDSWSLKAYISALRNEGAEQPLVDARVKLAKIMLVRLRSAPEKEQNYYRIVVDLTLPLFRSKDNRQLFLVVVREYYHFWIGNPQAASMVLQE